MQEGVARLVDTAIRQLAQTPGPATNGLALAAGAQYQFAPITEHDAHAHIAANPAAASAHLVAPQDVRAVNAAQTAYAAGQVDEFAQLAGVQDPTLRQEPEPETGPILW